jgi:hypothetical protein
MYTFYLRRKNIFPNTRGKLLTSINIPTHGLLPERFYLRCLPHLAFPLAASKGVIFREQDETTRNTITVANTARIKRL